MSTPELKWEINGDSVTAWVNDLEMLDISPDVNSPVGFPHRLTLNHVGRGGVTHLGWYHWISDAQAAAQRHIAELEVT